MPRLADQTESKQLNGKEQVTWTYQKATEGLKMLKVFPYEVQAFSDDNIWPDFSPNHRTMILGDFSSGFDNTRFNGSYDGLVAYNTASGLIDSFVAVGDVSDDIGGQEVDTLVGQFSGIYKYTFWSAAGNHDYDSGAIADFKSYFGHTDTYFSKKLGDVEYIFLDSNSHADNDISNAAAFQASTMGQWAINAIKDSTATWKVVVFHHPAYSSDSTHGSTSYMQLDWGALGAHAVLNGHCHTYERIHKDGIVYINAGAFAGTPRTYSTQISDSQVIRTGDDAIGYTLVSSDPFNLTFQFMTTGNVVVDRVRIARIV